MCGGRISPFALIPGAESPWSGLGHTLIPEPVTGQGIQFSGPAQLPILAAEGLGSASPKLQERLWKKSDLSN